MFERDCINFVIKKWNLAFVLLQSNRKIQRLLGKMLDSYSAKRASFVYLFDADQRSQLVSPASFVA